jgi:hypothetical protein
MRVADLPSVRLVPAGRLIIGTYGSAYSQSVNYFRMALWELFGLDFRIKTPKVQSLQWAERFSPTSFAESALFETRATSSSSLESKSFRIGDLFDFL